ncbi:MAG: class I SAM-dependent methyltransferase [Nitriliruptoraceae bacterium]
MSRTDDRFDARAETYDTASRIARADMVARHIRDAVVLHPTMRLLEYGAGTGLVSERLADRVGSITLADRSTGMLEVLRRKVDAGVFGDARVWDFDVGRGDTSGETFDRIVSSMVLHHIPDLDPVLTGLATLLTDDGIACLVDLDAEDGSFHRDREAFDGHNGFDREAFGARLRRCGFADVTFTSGGHIDKDGTRYPLFLAIAKR